MATTQVAHWRFTVADYHRMAEAGILTEDDRVELIDGEVVAMSPIGSRHAGTIIRLTQFLVPELGNTALVSVQNPLRLDPYHEPQPDILVLRPRDDYYSRGLPEASDVLLLIEVADTSLTYDRDVKLSMYARAGIPEAWIVDLKCEGIERHADPVEGIYRQVVRAGRGERLTSTVIPSLVIDIDTVFG